MKPNQLTLFAMQKWHLAEARSIRNELSDYPHIFTPGERRKRKREATKHETFARATFRHAMKTLSPDQLDRLKLAALSSGDVFSRMDLIKQHVATVYAIDP